MNRARQCTSYEKQGRNEHVRDGRKQHHLQYSSPGAKPGPGKTSGSRCQFIGGQRTEEHVDLHHECAVSKLQPEGYSTGQRAQVLQVQM